MVLNLKNKCLNSLDQVSFLYCPFCSMPVFLSRSGVGLVTAGEGGTMDPPEPSLSNEKRGTPRTVSPEWTIPVSLAYSRCLQTIVGMPCGKLVSCQFHNWPIDEFTDHPNTLCAELYSELCNSQERCVCFYSYPQGPGNLVRKSVLSHVTQIEQNIRQFPRKTI